MLTVPQLHVDDRCRMSRRPSSSSKPDLRTRRRSRRHIFGPNLKDSVNTMICRPSLWEKQEVTMDWRNLRTCWQTAGPCHIIPRSKHRRHAGFLPLCRITLVTMRKDPCVSWHWRSGFPCRCSRNCEQTLSSDCALLNQGTDATLATFHSEAWNSCRRKLTSLAEASLKAQQSYAWISWMSWRRVCP